MYLSVKIIIISCLLFNLIYNHFVIFFQIFQEFNAVISMLLTPYNLKKLKKTI